MRLKYADKSSGIRLTCCRKSYSDLCRVMGIVVYNPDAAFLPLRLKTSLRSMKARKSILNLCKSDTCKACNSNAGKRIEHIVTSRNIEGDTPHLHAALKDGEGNNGTMRLDVCTAVVCLLINRIRNHPACRLGRNLAQDFILETEDCSAVLIHLVDELMECRDDLLHRSVMIHVVILDIRHNGDVRMQFEEGAVALVCLRDKEAARAELLIRAEIGHLAADNDGR